MSRTTKINDKQFELIRAYLFHSITMEYIRKIRKGEREKERERERKSI